MDYELTVVRGGYMAEKVQYQASLLCDLGEYLEGYRIVNISIDADKGVYVLAVDGVPPRINGMFTQTKTFGLYKGATI